MSERILMDKTGRRRSPAVMPGYPLGVRRRTKGCDIPQTRPGWRRSLRSCAKPPRGTTP
jgi:hypothetical protein